MSFYKKLILNLLDLSKKKISFKKLKKKNYLIIENSNSEIIKKYIGKKNVQIVSFNNSINILLIIILFLKRMKISKINYYNLAITLVNPKIIITAIDTDKTFYKLKYSFKRKIFISIQNGYRLDHNFIVKKNEKLWCDQIFCLGNQNIKFFQKRIKANILPIGSLKNNYIVKKKNEIKEKNCFAYISQYRKIVDTNKQYYHYKKISWKDYGALEKKLIINFYNFCSNKKIPFYIVGCDFNYEEEKLWYEKLLNSKKINFIERKKFDSSYIFLQRSRYIVCMDSTLGYEFLGRGKKVIFFSRSTKKLKTLDNEFKFGFPYIKNNKGFFYSDLVSNQEIRRLVNNLTQISDRNWLKKIDKIKSQLMIYDPGNKAVIKKLNEYI